MLMSLTALAGAGAGVGFTQLTVPDVGKTQSSAFEGLERLSRLGAYVIDDKGEKIGDIKKYGTDFTLRYQCTRTINPPQIVVKQDDELYAVGYMTPATSLYGKKGQLISPYLVRAWQQSQ